MHCLIGHGGKDGVRNTESEYGVRSTECGVRSTPYFNIGKNMQKVCLQLQLHLQLPARLFSGNLQCKHPAIVTFVQFAAILWLEITRVKFSVLL